MKIENQRVANNLSYYKKAVKELVRDFTYCKMIGDSIKHLILPGFKLIITEKVDIIPYNPKFPPRADQWDAQVEKVAKFLGTEPSKTITKKSLNASFYISTYKHRNRVYDKFWNASAGVYITTSNTESCEIEMVEEVVERPKLTGYCAELEKKTYLKPA